MEITKFLADLASDLPAPGGGATSALSGAMGAALVSMVANLTINREKYAQFQELAINSAKKANELMQNLIQCINKDMSSFDGVIKALKLPKNTESEKLARSQALQEAYKMAISAPFEIVNNCLEVMKLSRNLIGKSNITAECDLTAALSQCNAAINIALENVRINLAFIKDSQYNAQMSEWVLNSERESKELISWQK